MAVKKRKVVVHRMFGAGSLCGVCICYRDDLGGILVADKNRSWSPKVDCPDCLIPAYGPVEPPHPGVADGWCPCLCCGGANDQRDNGVSCRRCWHNRRDRCSWSKDLCEFRDGD